MRPGALEEQENTQMTIHFKTCTSCQKIFDEMELKLQKMNQINLNECQTHLSRLPDYLDGELDTLQQNAIQSHLNDCENCQQALNWLENWPDWDTLAKQAAEIPKQARARIENKVLAALQLEKIASKASIHPENAAEIVKTAIHILKLTFRPVVSDFAFRASGFKTSKVIQHPGGELKLKTGLPKVSVELTSVFEDFQINTKTDRSGDVSFVDLNQGEYVVQVPGFELEKIIIEAP
jgi:hypothetical protein